MAINTVPPAPQSPALSSVFVHPFFPALDCNAVRDVVRLGDIVTHPRLVAAIEGAGYSVVKDLSEWLDARAAEGVSASADYSRAAGQSGPATPAQLEMLFARAVTAYAAAELIEAHRDVSATPLGQARQEVNLECAEALRRAGLAAVRDILGISRMRAELV